MHVKNNIKDKLINVARLIFKKWRQEKLWYLVPAWSFPPSVARGRRSPAATGAASRTPSSSSFCSSCPFSSYCSSSSFSSSCHPDSNLANLLPPWFHLWLDSTLPSPYSNFSKSASPWFQSCQICLPLIQILTLNLPKIHLPVLVTCLLPTCQNSTSSIFALPIWLIIPLAFILDRRLSAPVTRLLSWQLDNF